MFIQVSVQLLCILKDSTKMNQISFWSTLVSSTDLSLVQPVQTVVDPLLHIQTLLQLLSVVLDGDSRVSLGDVPAETLTQVQV